MKKISPLVRMYILVFSICALVLASAVWFDNNAKPLPAYLPNVEGGMFWLPATIEHTDDDLRSMLETLIEERQKHD